MKRGTNNKVAKLGQIRVISGQWRGRKLPVVNADGLRPTTDRTKETLFNWLAPYISGRNCLDLFAGTGSLGIEALSRNARTCQFVEKNKQAAELIRENMTTLKAEQAQYQVLHCDALMFLATCHQPFDLIFLDPPFKQGFIEKVITLIEQHNCLAPDGLIYLETEIGAQVNVPNDWVCIKHSSTKTLTYQLYRRENETST